MMILFTIVLMVAAVYGMDNNDTTVPMITPNECTICLTEIIEDEDVKKLPCNHQFHSDCINQWFDQGNNTCPNCRADATPVITTAQNRKRKMLRILKISMRVSIFLLLFSGVIYLNLLDLIISISLWVNPRLNYYAHVFTIVSVVQHVLVTLGFVLNRAFRWLRYPDYIVYTLMSIMNILAYIYVPWEKFDTKGEMVTSAATNLPSLINVLGYNIYQCFYRKKLISQWNLRNAQELQQQQAVNDPIAAHAQQNQYAIAFNIQNNANLIANHQNNENGDANQPDNQ